jgi:solute carrier family 35 protein F1/2
MLSAQLINFWAIVVVVVLSFIFLKVRYHITQIAGIVICIGGMGVLIASDHLTGTNGGDISSGNQLKGDLFALLGASFYGLTNTAEEYFVSKRPVYEVLGQLSLYGCIIDGVQSAIFERSNYHTSTWDGKVGGYLVGFTLCLTLFYCLAPLLFRLSSAAFFNVSLLTMNFWGVCIGIKVFHYHIHWMYPIAFVLIIVGQLIYYLGQKALAEARKPWLGQNQEGGVAGLFTAKQRIEHVVAGGTEPSEHERARSPEANTSAA